MFKIFLGRVLPLGATAALLQSSVSPLKPALQAFGAATNALAGQSTQDSGADFATIAKEQSTDTGSAAQGGSLGCLGAQPFVKEFQDAADALPVGATSAPVQTQYGWHVIRLDDTRSIAPPALESVKERLVQIVESKKFKAHQDELLKTAKVEKKL